MPENANFADYGLIGVFLTITLGVIVYLWRQFRGVTDSFMDYLKERAEKDHQADMARSAATTQLSTTLTRMEGSIETHERASNERHAKMVELINDIQREIDRK